MIKYLLNKSIVVISKCKTCLKCKENFVKEIGFLSELGPAKEKFEIISIDTSGGFRNYNSPKKFMHVAVYHFSRYAWFTCSKNQKGIDYINLIQKVMKDGKPKVILCDQYSAFDHEDFQKFLKLFG